MQYCKRFSPLVFTLLSTCLIYLAQSTCFAVDQSYGVERSLKGTYLSGIKPSGPRSESAMQGFRNPKLDSALSRLSYRVKRQSKAASDLASSLGFKVKNDKIWVLVLSKQNRWDEAEAILWEAGAEGLKTSLWRKRRLRCWLPIRALEAVAAENAIFRIRRPKPVFVPPPPPDSKIQPTQGAVTSEALPVMNVPAWHEANLKGQGVKVGIIDLGFEGYTDLLGTELPSNVTVRNFVEGEGEDEVDGYIVHGTACAEIIHDVAPLAELYFVKIDESDDIEEATDWFIGQKVDVISASISYANEDAGDGETPAGCLAEQVTRARNNGLLIVAAAGNDRLLHWGGTFDPFQGYWGSTKLTFNIWGDTIGIINCFGQDGIFPDSCDEIGSGVNLQAGLRWADWGEPEIDYNLYIARWDQDLSDWRVVAESWDPQTGWPEQTPTEDILNYTTTGEATYYGVFASWFGWGSEGLVNLDLFTPSYWGRLRHFKTPRSIAGGMAVASDAVTVTALDVNAPYPQEDYSSEGPRNGPGGTENNATAQKPNLAGYANVSTSSYGPTGFPGTSAATPHVAGSAALVTDAYPRKTVDEVQQFLEWRAKPMGNSGWDTVYGHGRVHLGDTPDPGAEAMEALMLLLLTGDEVP